MKPKLLCSVLAAATLVSAQASVLPVYAEQTGLSRQETPLAAAENEELTSAQAVLDAVKTTPPSVSEDGSRIILPSSSNENYEVILYGSSNEAVIAMDGTIHAPLEDMEVSVMYKVVNREDETDFALDQRAEASLVIPGRFSAAETDNARPRILPGIQEWKGDTGSLVLDASARLIVQDEALQDSAQVIQEYFAGMLGWDIEISTDPAAAGDIVLSLNSDLHALGEEGYTLQTADVVSIQAPSAKGVLYGGTTLVQILMQEGNSVPKGQIRDYPAYEVRSCMQDVARFYMPLDYLEEVTQYMAFFKLNEFHVHINDNGGEQGRALRVESKKYPELNSSLNPEEVYSQEDYRDYQKRCARYGIEVVTEIDTPAHSGFIADYDPSLMLDGYHIDLSNENVLPFIKSLLDEYLDGDDPVFQGSKFNIGTDEYDKNYSELVRAYMNELIEYVSGKGREVRLWASLGTNGFNGTTPVSNNAVGHYWSASWASYDEMLNMGYPCINNNDGNLYTVPGAGYYHDYIDFENLYNNWEAHYLVPSYHIAKANPLMLGSEAACWYDTKTGMSEFDIFDRTREQIALMAEKNWSGIKREGQSAEEFVSRVEDLAKRGPLTNPARYVESQGETVVSYDFESVQDDTVLDASGNGYDGLLTGTSVEADPQRSGNQVLALNQEGSLSLPFDSMGFPYSISFDLYLDGTQAENAVLFSGKDGVMYANYEGTGKIAYQRKGYTYLFDVKIPENVWVSVLLTCDNEACRLYFNDLFAAQGHYHKVTGASKEASSTFVLPLEEVGSGLQGWLDNLTIHNAARSYEEISGMDLLDYSNRALKKPVQVSGLEVSDGRFTGEMANDGDASTRVSLERKDDAWWQVDLEKVYRLEEIVINWNEKPNSYQIQVSEDGETWTTVYEDKACTERASGIETISLNRTVSARYVRYQQLKQFLYKTDTYTGYYSGNFREFEVWAFSEEDSPILSQAASLLAETERTESNGALLDRLALGLDLMEMTQASGTKEEMVLVVRSLQRICQALEAGEVWADTDTAALEQLVRNKIDPLAYSDASGSSYLVYYRIAMGSLLDGTLSQDALDSVKAMLEESLAALEVRDFITASSSRQIYQTNAPWNLLDGKETTWFWTNGEQKAGDYVEFRLRTPQKLRSITVSNKGCGGDTMKAAVVKLSTDGRSWKTVGTLDGSQLQTAEFEEQEALYVRIELTEGKSNWWKMCQVIFNGGKLCDWYWLEQEISTPVSTEGCTTSSIAAWNEALQAAKTLREENDSTQAQVDAALAALQQARASLEVIGDLSPVQEIIAQYETLDPAPYTAYSWQKLQTALSAARALLEDPSDAGSRTIERTIQAVTEAAHNLKELVNGVDTSALDEALENLREDESTWSVHSWQAYRKTAEEAAAYAAGEKGTITVQGIQEYLDTLQRVEGSLKVKEQSNIALHKPVTCSGLEVDREDVRADKVTDGNLSTRIALHQKNDAWITIDLEEETQIDRVIFRWKERPKQYKVQISSDNENWTDVYLNTACQGGTAGDDIIDFAPVMARYVKYQQIEMQDIGYSGTCWEFEVYGSDLSLYTDELAWQIQSAKDLLPQIQNEALKASLSQALEEAQQSLNGSDQEAMDTSASRLRALRLEHLQQGDASALRQAVEAVLQLQEEDYTPASWSALQQALEQAQSLLQKPASQQELDDARNTLLQAQAALVHRADTTLLQQAVDYAKSVLDQNGLEGVNELVAQEFQSALEEAQALLADPNASQAQITQSWLRLSRAIQMLNFRSDKEELQALVDQAEQLDLDLYADDEAKAELEQALDYARQVLADPAALNEQSIAQAVSRLQAALAGLHRKADTTLLAWLIAETEDTDLALYVNPEPFASVLEEARAVLAHPESQEAVDQMVQDLNSAWMQLRRRPDESLLAELQEALVQIQTLCLENYAPADQTRIAAFASHLEEKLADEQLDEDTALLLLQQSAGILQLKPAQNTQTGADPKQNAPADSVKPSETLQQTDEASHALTAKNTSGTRASVKTSVSLLQPLFLGLTGLGSAAAGLLAVRRKNRKQK